MMMINDMRETYCSFDIAKLLKERGFGVQCKGVYTKYLKTSKSDNPSFRMKKGELTIDGDYIMNNGPDDFSCDYYYQCARPTHALAIEWIRVNFNLHIYTDYNEIHKWWYCINNTSNNEREDGSQFNSPQEATEAALLYTLKNLIQ